jgi:hypothetical protein
MSAVKWGRHMAEFAGIGADQEDLETSYRSKLTLPELVALRGTPDMPEFQVCVLGAKGSGKTVFLAALYKSLMTQDKRRNSFFLGCPNSDQRAELLDKINALQDTSGEWPDPTYLESYFNFECLHNLKGKDINLFRFRYVDFPGGFLVRPPKRFSVDSYARSSHSIIVLLDGQKIVDLLNGNLTPISSDLDKMIHIIQPCIGRPIHFVITKSDLLNLADQTLESIRDRLLRHKGFRDVVEQLVEHGPVRLIPVSAVGPNFAKYENGVMKKCPDGVIEPMHVDLSIGMTLVDQIKMLKAAGLVKSSEEAAEEQAAHAKLWLVDKSRWLIAKILMLSELAKKLNNDSAASTFMQFLPINLTAMLAHYESYVKMADGRFAAIATGLEDEISRLSDSIFDRKSALAAVIEIQAALVAAFEKKFPGSKLSPIIFRSV